MLGSRVRFVVFGGVGAAPMGNDTQLKPSPVQIAYTEVLTNRFDSVTANFTERLAKLIHAVRTEERESAKARYTMMQEKGHLTGSLTPTK